MHFRMGRMLQDKMGPIVHRATKSWLRQCSKVNGRNL